MGADGGIEFLIDINAKLDAATQASSALDRVTASANKSDEALYKAERAAAAAQARFARMNRVEALPFAPVFGPHEATQEDHLRVLQKRLRELQMPGKMDELQKQIHALESPEAPKQVGLLGKAFADVESSAAGFIAGMGVMAVGGMIFRGIEGVIEKVHELGSEMLTTAGEAQRTERAMTTLMGAEVAPDILDWIDQMARTTEFTDGPLKNLAIDLARAGFAGEDLSRAMSAVTDMAAMSTDKVSGAANAVEMLSRVRLKGGVNDRELLRLGISPDAFYKRLAGEIGIGAKEVEKKLQEGKIEAETVIEALYSSIAEKTGKPLGGAGLSMTTTFLSQLEKAKDIVPNLFEGLSQSGGLDSITESLGRLTTALAPDSPNGKRIIDGLEHMLNAFADLLDKVDMDKFADTAVHLFEMLPPLIEAATKAMLMFVRAVEGLVDRGGIAGIFEGISGSSGLGTIAGLALDPARTLRNLGIDAVKGYAAGVDDGAPLAYDAMGNAIGASIDGAKDKAEIQSPSKVFMRIGEQTSEGYQKGITDSEPDIRDAVQSSFRLPPPGALQPDGYAPPAASGGGGWGGAGGIAADITVNIGPVHGDEAGAREVSAAAEVGVMQALQRSMERWQQQVGGG